MSEASNNELALTAARSAELHADPVRGNFDAAHLIEIHRRLTQDIPEHLPGQFRPAVAGQHVKARELSTGLRYEVPYTDATDIAGELQRTLGARDLVGEFRGLAKNDFAEKMAKLYSSLDRTHPFVEANSRTLRTFTAQLAREAGHGLAWNKMIETKNGRDLLYLARDHAVFERAFPGVGSPTFEPKDRMQAEADNIVSKAGKAYPTLGEVMQRLHQEIEQTRTVDRDIER